MLCEMNTIIGWITEIYPVYSFVLIITDGYLLYFLQVWRHNNLP